MLSRTSHLLCNYSSTSLYNPLVLRSIVDLWHNHPLLILFILVSLHGKGLARSSLAIGEDSRVITLHYSPHQLVQACLLKHLALV